ncbi:hypothetical protein PUN28_001059 [Cardiocondyla obscurior]|uniref:REJ domain-containing protein n=1 Tax=Cardiocondyla obscurior TaxID=286306 RepID=A0AAW2H2Q9_9HYME
MSQAVGSRAGKSQQVTTSSRSITISNNSRRSSHSSSRNNSSSSRSIRSSSTTKIQSRVFTITCHNSIIISITRGIISTLAIRGVG